MALRKTQCNKKNVHKKGEEKERHDYMIRYPKKEN